MRKIILTLLFIVPLITGCTSINANLSINNDKSAQLDLQMISDSKARPRELLTMKSNVSKFLNKSEFEIQDDSSQDNVKIYAHKKTDNLLKQDLDLSSLGFTTKLQSGKFIDVNHNFFITLYNIDMVYNLKNQQDKIKFAEEDEIPSNGGLNPEYLQKYADVSGIKDDDLVRSDFLENIDPNVLLKNAEKKANTNKINAKNVKDNYKLFDISNLTAKFSISLPTKASINNAKIVNGNTYTWVLNKTSPTEIRLQYVVYNGFAISFILLLGIGLIVYLAYRIYRHETLKRIGNNN